MLNFQYYTPTKVVFGKGVHKEVGKLVKEMNCKKVLVHFGGQSAKKSGLLDEIFQALDAEGVSYVSLGGVVPNPRLSKVYEGLELAKAEGVDFILAVGGGSVIDSAKAISYGMKYDGDVWDFYARKAVVQDSLPVGVVLTIAAAGSEMSNSSVITNEEGWLKRGCNTDWGRAKFALLNPELTYTLPAYQTACGCVDIMMHSMERYFSQGGSTPLTDALAEGVIRTVKENALILKDDPTNYDARAQVMWGSSLSHNGLTGCGREGDWASHQLEHELGGMFDIAHGAGLAAVWSSWARYVYKEDVQRFARFATQVMGIAPDAGTQEEIALAGIAAMEDFYHQIDMPARIGEMDIQLTDAQIEELAYKCSFEETRTIGSFKKLDKEDMKAIYKMAQ